MVRLRLRLRTGEIWRPAARAAFLLLLFVYVWIAVDPRLIHHSLGLVTDYSSFVFSDGWPFLAEHLARPGGLVQYLAALLSQLFSFGWAGALIVTLSAWGLGRFTVLMTRLADERVRDSGFRVQGSGCAEASVVRLVPAAILLVMFGRYHYPMGTIVSLLVGLSCFAVYAVATPGKATHRLLVLLAGATAAYYAAGAGSLVFPILVAAYEIFGAWRGSPDPADCSTEGRPRAGRPSVARGAGSGDPRTAQEPGPARATRVSRVFVAIAALLCAGTVPWLVGTLRFGLSADRAYGQFLLTEPGLSRAETPYGLILLAFYPLVLGFGIARLWRAKLLPAAAVFSALGVVAWFSLDTAVKTLLEMDVYSRQEKWDEVLEAARRMPRGQYNVHGNRNVLLALHHTRRLGDEMFSYPQMRETSPFATPQGRLDYGGLFHQSRLYFYLGQINYAEKCGYDALGVAGDVPAALEHLALVSVARGRVGAAGVLLNALHKNPFYRARAAAMIQAIEDNPRLQHDPRIRQISSLAPDSDSFTRKIDLKQVLGALLVKNPQNRMAFEFLMAHYLTTGRPEKVAENTRRLVGLGYDRMPRHYQEAFLIHLGPEGAKFHAAPYEIQPEVLRDFQAFLAITQREPDGKAAARDAQAAGLGNTYFFFLTFGYSGG